MGTYLGHDVLYSCHLYDPPLDPREWCVICSTGGGFLCTMTHPASQTMTDICYTMTVPWVNFVTHHFLILTNHDSQNDARPSKHASWIFQLRNQTKACRHESRSRRHWRPLDLLASFHKWSYRSPCTVLNSLILFVLIFCLCVCLWFVVSYFPRMLRPTVRTIVNVNFGACLSFFVCCVSNSNTNRYLYF